MRIKSVVTFSSETSANPCYGGPGQEEIVVGDILPTSFKLLNIPPQHLWKRASTRPPSDVSTSPSRLFHRSTCLLGDIAGKSLIPLTMIICTYVEYRVIILVVPRESGVGCAGHRPLCHLAHRFVPKQKLREMIACALRRK